MIGSATVKTKTKYVRLAVVCQSFFFFLHINPSLLRDFFLAVDVAATLRIHCRRYPYIRIDICLHTFFCCA